MHNHKDSKDTTPRPLVSIDHNDDYTYLFARHPLASASVWPMYAPAPGLTSPDTQLASASVVLCSHAKTAGNTAAGPSKLASVIVIMRRWENSASAAGSQGAQNVLRGVIENKLYNNWSGSQGAQNVTMQQQQQQQE